MKTRYYVIEDATTETTRIVNAASQAQAIRHVTRGRFACRPATPADIVQAMEAGTGVEYASKKEASE